MQIEVDLRGLDGLFAHLFVPAVITLATPFPIYPYFQIRIKAAELGRNQADLR